MNNIKYWRDVNKGNVWSDQNKMHNIVYTLLWFGQHFKKTELDGCWWKYIILPYRAAKKLANIFTKKQGLIYKFSIPAGRGKTGGSTAWKIPFQTPKVTKLFTGTCTDENSDSEAVLRITKCQCINPKKLTKTWKVKIIADR